MIYDLNTCKYSKFFIPFFEQYENIFIFGSGQKRFSQEKHNFCENSDVILRFNAKTLLDKDFEFFKNTIFLLGGDDGVASIIKNSKNQKMDQFIKNSFLIKIYVEYNRLNYQEKFISEFYKNNFCFNEFYLNKIHMGDWISECFSFAVKEKRSCKRKKFRFTTSFFGTIPLIYLKEKRFFLDGLGGVLDSNKKEYFSRNIIERYDQNIGRHSLNIEGKFWLKAINVARKNKSNIMVF
jgi:hypothetical protein